MILRLRADAGHIPLADGSAHCVCTSPPYYGLRVYSGVPETVWGGDPAHAHEWGAALPAVKPGQVPQTKWAGVAAVADGQRANTGAFCACGAWRGCLGNEPTVDMYVAHLVECFREVRRVLRSDGVCWLVLGDSFHAGGRSGHGTRIGYKQQTNRASAAGVDNARASPDGIEAGNLLGVPWRVALALQADGWLLRNDVVWAKRATMPESVSGWEYRRHRIRLTRLEHEALSALPGDEARRRFLQSRWGEAPRQQMQRMQAGGTSPVEGYSSGAGDDPSGEAELPPDGRLSALQANAGLRETVSALQGEVRAEFGRDGETAGMEIHGERTRCTGSPECRSQDAPRTAGGHVDSDRVDGDEEPREGQMLLLREEAQADAGSRDPLVQGGRAHEGERRSGLSPLQREKGGEDRDAVLIDCPGCRACTPNDGLVLRRGSWRHTRSHEEIFMLAKSMGYFCDAEAVAEQVSEASLARVAQESFSSQRGGDKDYALTVSRNRSERRVLENFAARAAAGTATRNPRSFMLLGPEPLREAHYAAFPTALVEPLLLASTSARGVCRACGAPWARIVERFGSGTRKKLGEHGPSDYANAQPVAAQGLDYAGGHGSNVSESRTLGWRATCSCNASAPVPATVLDPFAGSGTTGAVAVRLRRRAVLCDLSQTYLRDIADARTRNVQVELAL